MTKASLIGFLVVLLFIAIGSQVFGNHFTPKDNSSTSVLSSEKSNTSISKGDVLDLIPKMKNLSNMPMNGLNFDRFSKNQQDVYTETKRIIDKHPNDALAERLNKILLMSEDIKSFWSLADQNTTKFYDPNSITLKMLREKYPNLEKKVMGANDKQGWYKDNIILAFLGIYAEEVYWLEKDIKSYY